MSLKLGARAGIGRWPPLLVVCLGGQIDPMILFLWPTSSVQSRPGPRAKGRVDSRARLGLNPPALLREGGRASSLQGLEVEHINEFNIFWQDSQARWERDMRYNSSCIATIFVRYWREFRLGTSLGCYGEKAKSSLKSANRENSGHKDKTLDDASLCIHLFRV